MRFGSMMLAAGLAVAASGCSTLSSITSSGGDAPPPPAPATADTSAAPADGVRVASGSSVTGMSGEDLRAAWGEPSLKRSDTGAELWQYSNASCTLLVYLYPSAGTLTVSRAEALPGGADEAAVTACAKAAGKPPLKPIS
jgi:hypothetical protein